MNRTLKPAVFFDRDGIVNRSPGPGYVERLEDFHLLDEFIAALRVVRARGWPAVIVTNQRGVGLGLMTEAELGRIHAHLRTELQRVGLDLAGLYACTAEDRDHPDRKPRPGMLLRAAEELGLDLSRSWMIGDSERDIEAGLRAGCAHTVLIGPDTPERPTQAEIRLERLENLADCLSQRLENRTGPEGVAG